MCVARLLLAAAPFQLFFFLPLPLLFSKEKNSSLSQPSFSTSELLEHQSYRPSNQYVHKLNHKEKGMLGLKGLLKAILFFFCFVFLLIMRHRNQLFVRSSSQREREYVYRRVTNRNIDPMHHHFLSLNANTNAKHHCDYCIVVSPVVAAIKKVLN